MKHSVKRILALLTAMAMLLSGFAFAEDKRSQKKSKKHPRKKLW